MPNLSNPDLAPSTTAQAGSSAPADIDLVPAEEAVRLGTSHTAVNGLRYSTFGLLDAPYTAPAELARLVSTVPVALTAALADHVYAFVPLALSAARLSGDDSSGFSPDDKTLIAARATEALADKATCHRNSTIARTEHVFLSARLHPDRFALAFEFFINIAHNFVDTTGGLPEIFADTAWAQALSGVRGETSIDAWEHRAEALGTPEAPAAGRTRRSAESTRTSGFTAHSAPALSGQPGRTIDEKARTAFLETAFSDTLAIYLLALYLDFDYADLRERDYPLLAPNALADRLRLVNKLFPANPGYEFAIRYRRKG